MPVKQQFIVEIQNALVKNEDSLADDTPVVTILLEHREAAEQLYADLREALGYAGRGMDPTVAGPEAPTPALSQQDIARRRALHAADNPDLEPEVWTPEMIEASLALDGEQEIPEDVVPTDPIAAAAAAQASDRRALQAADPANAGSFLPHVASTVPPNNPRGSSFGVIRVDHTPEQAY